MTVTSQNGTTGDGGSTTSADDTSNTGDGGQSTSTSQEVDLTTLKGDQLTKVLENPELFKMPRIAEAIEAQKQLKKLQAQQDQQTNESLAEQKKWQELAQKHETENASLKQTIQDNAVNQALTTKLYGVNVVDLDGALKLIDKSKVSVDDNGQIVGVDEAIESLKTDKAYLFNNTNQSGGSNAGSPAGGTQQAPTSSGQFKFKESQLTPEFYNKHKEEIHEAQRNGQIEADGPPR